MSNIFKDSVQLPIQSPEAIDAFVQGLQGDLQGLSWLTNAYHIAEDAHDRDPNTGIDRVYPQTHLRTVDKDPYERYINLMPTVFKGSAFSFFQMYGYDFPVWQSPNNNPLTTVDLSLIVYCNFKAINPDAGYRFYEILEKDVLSIFNGYAAIKVNSIQRRFEDVYAGYTLREVEGQYISAPFGAFKVNFSFDTRVNCLNI